MRRARRAMGTADPILERAAGSPPNTSQVSLQSRFAYTPPRKVLHVWRRLWVMLLTIYMVYMVTHGAYQVNCVDLFVCMSVDMGYYVQMLTWATM